MMKVFIMTDLEGPGGVVGKPRGDGALGHQILNYDVAGAMLTGEVNACAEGLSAAGVTEIVAIDGHGGGNAFKLEQLHPLVSAGSLGGVMYPRSFGMNPEFDAAMQIGAHAMTGQRGFLNHTFSSGLLNDMYLNGQKIGEIGIEILLAAYFGVPTILVSGDVVACQEALDFLGFEIPVVVTKNTPYRYTVINRPVAAIRTELREKSAEAIRNLDKFPVKKISGPFELTVRWMSVNTADECERRGAERLDDQTVRFVSNDFLDVWAQQQGWGAGAHIRKFPELHRAGVWK
ncbi:MAG: M55 family metallopeptidase [Lentisphaeria bacterium]|nr:M55 family metallopeptidase [Lentisphaeria bacterium]